MEINKEKIKEWMDIILNWLKQHPSVLIWYGIAVAFALVQSQIIEEN